MTRDDLHPLDRKPGFGKYRGKKTFGQLIQYDRMYVRWLMGERWFQSKYSDVWEAIRLEGVGKIV